MAKTLSFISLRFMDAIVIPMYILAKYLHVPPTSFAVFQKILLLRSKPKIHINRPKYMDAVIGEISFLRLIFPPLKTAGPTTQKNVASTINPPN